ncbi:MAG: AMP-binding protein [Deltaproteobacteria bacterium]
MAAKLDIDRAFAGRGLVLTGATGFLGKVVLSMLLDRYPDAGPVYVVVRPGTSGSAEERFFSKVLPSHPFDPLRERHGAGALSFLRERIRVLDGDVTDPSLGLSDADVNALAQARPAAFLNCAGLVSFNPSLELALGVNAVGAKNAAELCQRLDLPLVHVSTCFVAGERHGPVFEDEPVVGSYPRQQELGEAAPGGGRRRRAPGGDQGSGHSLEQGPEHSIDVPRELLDCQRLIAAARAEADDGARAAAFRASAIERLREEGRDPRATVDERALRLAIARERKLWLSGELVRLGMERARRWGWPNTYTYTKSLGEQLIAATAGLRYSLARPSIVESALRYPFPGWNEGFTTSAPLAFLGLKGHRSLPAGERCILDLIPVDLVAAGLLSITAAAAAGEADPVYQLASGDSNPFYAARAVELVGLYRRRVFRRKETGSATANQIAARIETRPVSRDRYELLSAPMAKRLADGLSGLIERRRPRWGAPVISALADRAQERLGAASRELSGVVDLIDLFLPFLWENSYLFRCDRTRALHARLTPADQAKLPWDPEKLDWRHYFIEVHMAGLEKWVFPGLEEERVAGRRVRRAHRDLLELFEAACEAHGPRVLFRRVSGGDSPEEIVTYARARTLAHRAAAFLSAQGISKGDRVLLASENRPEWPIACFGVLLCGGVLVPVDPELSREELLNLARASEAKLALCSEELLERLGPMEGSWCSLEAALRQPSAAEAPLSRRPQLQPDDPASLIFTSGTTGKPKGVLLSHRNFAQLAQKLSSVFDLAVGEGVLSILPLHHTFEFSCGLLVPLSCGAEVSYLDELTADRLGEALASGRIHAMIGVPAVWQLLHRKVTQELSARPGFVEGAANALMAANRELRDRLGLNLGKALFWPVHRRLGGRLRVLVSGGSALSEEVHEAFYGLGFTLTEGYGLTEAAPVLTVTPPGERRPAGSVGRALPGVELRIQSPDGSGVGEVLAKGPNVMLGYFGDPEATAQVLSDGWLRTGDLGRLDAEGNLQLVGRQKDVIIDANGKNVYPDELEELYRKDAPPGLLELSIVGLTSEGGGEKVACLAALEDEAARAEAQEHFARISKALPFYRRIQTLHLRTGELPKTATRKVKRSLVQKELQRLEEVARAGQRVKGKAGPQLGPEGWLAELIAELVRRPVDSVQPHSRLVQDLGFDSLLSTELAVALEQAGMTLPDGADVSSFETVAQLAQALQAPHARPTPSRGPSPAEAPQEISVPAPLAKAGRAVLSQAQRLLYERFFATEVIGRAFIPQGGSFLVAANHSSHLDMGLVKVALGEQGEKLCALAARDYFFSTPLRRAYFENFTRLIPIDRHGSLKASLELAAAAITEGWNLLIFPEGTRSQDGQLGEFKSTLGYLALAHGLDVLPVAIRGTHDALPKGGILPRARDLEVRIGPVLSIARLRAAGEGKARAEAYRAATQLVETEVRRLFEGGSSSSQSTQPEQRSGGRATEPKPLPRVARGHGEDGRS